MWTAVVAIAVFLCQANGLPQKQEPDSAALQNLLNNAQNLPRGRVFASIPDSVTDFALDFHKAVATGETPVISPCSQTDANASPNQDNVIFSPLSLSNSFSVLWRGSAGSTEQELTQALNYPEGSAKKGSGFHRKFGQFLNSVLRPDRGVTLDSASTFFGDYGTQVYKSFFEEARDSYKTDLRSVPFRDDPATAKKHINLFVKHATKDNIPEILSQAPDPDTAFMLVNAVFFNGAWETEFDPRDTREKDFFTSEQETLTVPMMYSADLNLKYYNNEEDKFEIIGIPYKGGEFHLYILLPHENYTTGLINLENKITKEILKGSIANMTKSESAIHLPKMELEDQLNLKSYLQDLGVCDLFTPQVQLTQMSKTRDILVNRAIHQTKLTINEEGTVAAGVTAVIGTKSGKQIRVNHPFMFLIWDDVNEIPVFMGRITRPA